MNTYIFIGMGIGLVVALILIKVLYRREKAGVKNDLQRIRTLFGNEEVTFKVRSYLANNKKIEAIKYVRDRSGAGLLESKNFVELIEKSKDTGSGLYQKTVGLTDRVTEIEMNLSSNDKILLEKIELLLKNQNKIEAIKLLAETKKARLIDAKNMVEAIEEKLKN